MDFIEGKKSQRGQLNFMIEKNLCRQRMAESDFNAQLMISSNYSLCFYNLIFRSVFFCSARSAVNTGEKKGSDTFHGIQEKIAQQKKAWTLMSTSLACFFTYLAPVVPDMAPR